jgi:regulator of nucleoside diphosphate kinase
VRRARAVRLVCTYPEDPPLVLGRSDAETLTALAIGAMLSRPREAGALLQELRRATVVPDDRRPADAVGLNCTVRFLEDGAPGEAVLVLPGDAAPLRGRVSVMSNLGAGLIGLCAGQGIAWPDRMGGARMLSVLQVSPPAGPAVHARADRWGGGRGR